MGRNINSSRYRCKRRRRVTSFQASNWAPIIKLLLCIFGILGGIALIVYVVLPNALPLAGIDFVPPGVSTPTPEPTPEPTPTPHPLEQADVTEIEREVVVTASQYKWFGDPYFFSNTLVFTAGELVNGATKMTTLFTLDVETEELKKQSITLENSHFISPVMNDEWLCYLDANYTGGGKIIACNRKDGSTPIIVKDVYTGQPALFLWENYLVWTERTGSYMDKLFVCDLTTQESVTVQMFEGSYYGVSKPCICNGKLVWADVDSEAAGGAIYSQIRILDMGSGQTSVYLPGSYVHDPKINKSGYIAWMDGNHGPLTNLYLYKGSGEKEMIAEGIVDFYMDDQFLTYSVNEQIWVYIFESGKKYELTKPPITAQLLGASGGYVVWMDVTSRDRDVMKYVKIPG